MAIDKDFRVKNGLYVATDANILGNTVIAQRLTANGNINFTSSPNVALGPVGNVVITGGTNGQYLQTNGSGGLTWAAVSVASISNGNSNVNIPAANGNVNISAVGNANILVVTGTGVNVNGTLNVTSTATFSGGTLNHTGTVSNITSSVANVTANLAGGATGSGNTKEVNIGTGGVSGSTTTITIGSANGTTTNINGTANVTGNLSVGNITTGSGTGGNITGANVISANTLILATAANVPIVQNGNSNVTIAANANVSVFVTGNATARAVFTSTGANIAGTANITGNANVGNLGTAQVLATANITTPQVIANVAQGTAPFLVNSNTVVANLNASLLLGATSAAAATANTIALRDTNGNITANFFIGNGSQLTGIVATVATISNGNSNVNIPAANGNVNISAVGNANVVVVTGTGANITGTANISGNAIANNLFISGIANIGNSATNDIKMNLTGALETVIRTIGTTNSTEARFGVSGANAQIITISNHGMNFGTNSIIRMTILAGLDGNIGIANTNPAHTLSVTGTTNISGNANVGNLGTAGLVSATGNVSGGNLTTTGVLSVTGTGVSSIAGNLDMTSNTIINLATPTSATDAATKQYVDDVAQGLNIHDSCNAATTTTLAIISGGTVTYNNGTSGVGATLTTTGTYTTIDGTTLANGMRILVKNEVNAAHNGIYVRTSTTVLTRATDFDQPVEMEGGDFTFVTSGTLYDNTGWVMTEPVTTVGTSNVIFVQFSGAGTYTAGTGLTLTGNEFSVNASQTQVTSVGTLSNLAVTGNVAFSGANVSLGAVGNIRITGGTANQVLRSDGASGAVSWQTLPVTNIQEFTATGGQTTFTVTGTYIVGSVLVFVNGIQMNSVDYTASNGTTVVLTEARVAGDTVRVVSSVGSVGLNNLQSLSVAMSVALGM